MTTTIDDQNACLIGGHIYGDATTSAGDRMCTRCGHAEPDQSGDYEYEKDRTPTPPAYKSRMLLCDVGEDGCPICRFLSGDHDTATVLDVIRRMDAALARGDNDYRALVKATALMRNRLDPVCGRGVRGVWCSYQREARRRDRAQGFILPSDGPQPGRHQAGRDYRGFVLI